MSIFTKVCAGLLISTLSVAAQAAQPGTDGQTPVQEPGEIVVEVTNPTEVIQVLHVGVEAEMKIIDLVKERNPDSDLQRFVDQISQEVADFDKRLEELAASKSVDLAPAQLSANAKVIETQMSQELQNLTKKQDQEFRAGVIEVLIRTYETALDLYTQVSEKNADEALKGAVSEIRPITQKHLDDIKQLQQGTEPTEPMQPAQPAE